MIVSHLSDSNKSHTFSVVQKEKKKKFSIFIQKEGELKQEGSADLNIFQEEKKKRGGEIYFQINKGRGKASAIYQ